MKNTLPPMGLIWMCALSLLSQVVAGQDNSEKELGSAITSGNWKQLASIEAKGPIGHFCKAVANGVIAEWRIMAQEAQKAKGNTSLIDTFCQDLLSQNMNNAYAHFIVATNLDDKGDTEKAIGEYKRAIELDPKFAVPYYQIGVHLGQMGKHTEKLAWLDKALTADPNYFPAYEAKGSAYKDMGRLDSAIAHFKTAVEKLEATNLTTGELMGRACYNWGWILVNQPSPDNDQGIAILTKAIKADPRQLSAYNELGIAYKRKGQFANAIRVYRDGISKGENTAMIYFNLGVAEYRNGNSSAAKTAFEKSVTLDPNGQTGSMARQWMGRIQ
jgi:superkiller protein 3